MTLTVRLFARCRDLAGVDGLAVDLPESPRVRDVRIAVVKACVKLADFLPRCSIAVNEAFAADDAPIPLRAEIAVIPPVSGG